MTSPVVIPTNISYNIKIPTNLDKELEIQYPPLKELSEDERIIILRKDKLFKKEKIIPPLYDTITPVSNCDEESIIKSFHDDDIIFI